MHSVLHLLNLLTQLFINHFVISYNYLLFINIFEKIIILMYHIFKLSTFQLLLLYGNLKMKVHHIIKSRKYKHQKNHLKNSNNLDLHLDIRVKTNDMKRV